MGSEDAELVRRCRRGDTAAMRELIEQFHGAVFGLCVRLLGHRHDAEDVTQEVFLRVFRSLHRWDGERPLRPWVMGIAVNRCRTDLAQRRRRPDLADYLPDAVAGPAPDDSAELVREIDRALSDIRPEYRCAFELYHDQGRSYDEIAQVLGRPVGTVKTWLHRARAELLEYLRRRGLVPPDGTDRPQPRARAGP